MNIGRELEHCVIKAIESHSVTKRKEGTLLSNVAEKRENNFEIYFGFINEVFGHANKSSVEYLGQAHIGKN